MSWSSSINSDCSLHEMLLRPCKEVTVELLRLHQLFKMHLSMYFLWRRG